MSYTLRLDDRRLAELGLCKRPPPAPKPDDVAGPWAFDIADTAAPPGWVFTARSHLINRFWPECERIYMPRDPVPGGPMWVRMRRGVTLSRLPVGRRRRLMARLSGHSAEVLREGTLLVDFRWGSRPHNWAHLIDNHLLLLFLCLDLVALDVSDVHVVLPADAPAYCRRLLETLAIGFVCTDAPVRGVILDCAFRQLTAVRAARNLWARGDAARRTLDRVRTQVDSAWPRRLFLARQDTRRLHNESEIAALLSDHGFTKVYAENWSPAQQLTMFDDAEAVVAIHGASLAPIVFRPADRLPLPVVEIFPCAHVTGVHRALATLSGCRWVGVRGRIEPTDISAAYRFGGPYTTNSLRDFNADPESVLLALRRLRLETA